MDIQWYPGHMTKAKREMTENIKLVDVIVELIDARIPLSSRNPDLQPLFVKPRLLVLTKRDLADAKHTERWLQYLETNNESAIAIDLLGDKSLSIIDKRVTQLVPSLRRPPRILVVGIPNVGKSSFINRIAKKSSAKVGAKPGVTRGKQWIRTGSIHLLDTPGVLWPKFEDQDVARRLAIVSSIRDEIFPWEEIALWLLNFLVIHYPDNLAKRYNLDAKSPTILEDIGERRGCLQAGGKVNLEKAAKVVLQDFRAGRLGRITLEFPS